MTARTEDVAAPVGSAARVALYAASVTALGVLLLSDHFANIWAPIPAVPLRHALTCAAGGLMLVSAVGLVWRKTVVPSSAVVTLLFLSWLLLLQVPRLVGAPSREVLWSGGAQLASLVAGGWILFASLAGAADHRERWFRGARGVRVARVLYALALPLFGFHHFADLAGAAEAVPTWLPPRVGWAFLTGAAHVAAGVAILVGIAARLAATLEAIMISAFVLLIHVPGVIGEPADRLQWTMFVAASAIAGAAWIVAGSYAGGAGGPGGPTVRSMVSSLRAR